MKLKFALSILGSAAALTLAGCGGGGDGGGGGIPMFPVAPTTPAPAPATPAPVPPAPETPAPEVPVVETPTTWKDANCEQTGTDLPLCTTNFSSKDARVTFGAADGGSVLRFVTEQTPLAGENDNVNEVKGNLAALGLSFLHGVKLSELPAIQYTLKDQGGAVNQYLNITISPQCDLNEVSNNTWTNLIVQRSDIAPAESAAHPGYTEYTARTSDAVWLRSSGAQWFAGETLLLNPSRPAAGAAVPTSLDAVIAAYPNACVFNYSNPGAARGGPALTPAVLIKLGTSSTETATEYTLKSLKIGDKVIFESKPVAVTPPVELPPQPV